ncbi:unnamed protein product [Bemisia tabaci]|uniref:N-acetyllactosaminide beta-1,3-N-acetylglucosaminyltransferase n=2 Tax=Bemisia tabaci TaxID=7038 RepID=A0A9P0A632_BEMTA|nr:unnamed protein product [Bemisia tabaci]
MRGILKEYMQHAARYRYLDWSIQGGRVECYDSAGVLAASSPKNPPARAAEMWSISRRGWCLRLSVVLNVAVLFYLAAHLAPFDTLGLGLGLGHGDPLGGPPTPLEESQASSRNLASYDAALPESGTATELLNYPQASASASAASQDFYQSVRSVFDGTTYFHATPNGTFSTTLRLPGNGSMTGDSGASGSGQGGAHPSGHPPTSTLNITTSESTTHPPPPPAPTLKDIVNCNDKSARHYLAQKGDFWVLYNYVTPAKSFRCWESITYTTHADYSFLDNLPPLVERWRGPVSLAIHAPGTDFAPTLNTINYLKSCTTPLVNDYVTFHIYFNSQHLPKVIPKKHTLFTEPYNCSLPPPYANVNTSTMYKSLKKILYPVNVGRNIAREAATTHYILASDIELYPSPGIIPDFLEMVQRQDPPLRRKNPKVFPLSIFEIEAKMNVPRHKAELVAMLKNGSAIPFHKKVCTGCHKVPKSKEWMAKANRNKGLRVFHIGKRTGEFIRWEPIYIGTHSDPLYDERLSWEGKSDKMTQGYALCALDYEFQILDNAFLVHKPGIKTLKKNPARDMLTRKTNTLIQKVIWPELKILYGFKKGCSV